MSVRPYHAEELDEMRSLGIVRDKPEVVFLRWLATVDARDAEIAALTAESDIRQKYALGMEEACDKLESEIAAKDALLAEAESVLRDRGCNAECSHPNCSHYLRDLAAKLTSALSSVPGSKSTIAAKEYGMSQTTGPFPSPPQDNSTTESKPICAWCWRSCWPTTYYLNGMTYCSPACLLKTGEPDRAANLGGEKGEGR